MIIKKTDEDSALVAAGHLKEGKVVIIPTDTVYGFSGIVDTAENKNHFESDAKIRAIKGRSETKPLIQLIAKPEDIFNHTDDKIPQELLAKWPGALTIIVHNKENADMTTAYRCPGDAWLRRVIELTGSPIFSTSVNRSGSPVLDTLSAIKSEFEGETALIVDDGDKKNALPSTLVMLENGEVKVLRQGDVKI
ncbi:MAG: L-threonylcarbamoyladenylate synthase [Treponema sp.]|nr:L-threonylcarbamoyladenylate synthase [Treponema sp.]